jgi:hypothetical protein
MLKYKLELLFRRTLYVALLGNQMDNSLESKFLAFLRAYCDSEGSDVVSIRIALHIDCISKTT